MFIREEMLKKQKVYMQSLLKFAIPIYNFLPFFCKR